MWSLGCVVYHMMMLRAPFDGTNPLSVASKIVEGSYDPVRGVCVCGGGEGAVPVPKRVARGVA